MTKSPSDTALRDTQDLIEKGILEKNRCWKQYSIFFNNVLILGAPNYQKATIVDGLFSGC